MALYVVIGPPAGGKSTWVRQNAKHGDITIDFDAITGVLTPPGPDPWDQPAHVNQVARAARQAAIDIAVTMRDTVDVYVIHSSPSDSMMDRYLTMGANIIRIDPGQHIAAARAKQERPAHMQGAIKAWYFDQKQPKPPGNSWVSADW